jgi:hypothetical protein
VAAKTSPATFPQPRFISKRMIIAFARCYLSPAGYMQDRNRIVT